MYFKAIFVRKMYLFEHHFVLQKTLISAFSLDTIIQLPWRATLSPNDQYSKHLGTWKSHIKRFSWIFKPPNNVRTLRAQSHAEDHRAWLWARNVCWQKGDQTRNCGCKQTPVMMHVKGVLSILLRSFFSGKKHFCYFVLNFRRTVLGAHCSVFQKKMFWKVQS